SLSYSDFFSFLYKKGFDNLVEITWKNAACMETNATVKLKKKLQALKIAIKQWVKDDKIQSNASKMFIQSRLADLDKIIDQGKGNEEVMSDRSKRLKDLSDLNVSITTDLAQKAKIRWAIEGDENSKYFHGIINKKRSQLAIRGVLIDGDWIDDPSCVKNEFLKHFSNVFAPLTPKLSFQSQFPNRVTPEQIDVLESIASYDEIKRAVWDYGINKSPGPMVLVLNSIENIGTSLTKMCDVQSAFVSNLQIFDGPFIINELISWCKRKNTKAMSFKVDFEKAFDSDTSNFAMIVKVLKWFFLASWLKINIHKSKLMGIGIPHDVVVNTTSSIGCLTLSTPFSYLGVKVGGFMARLSSWDDNIAKISFRLSKWKLKTLSIGGRFTLMKSEFFNGMDISDRKLARIGWKKILASKKNGGLGVSSLFALNRALLYKWIWRFISNGASLWLRFITAIHGVNEPINSEHKSSRGSLWLDIIREAQKLSNTCVNLLSLMKKVGNGEATVAAKLRDSSLISSFRRLSWGGIEDDQLRLLEGTISLVLLSQSSDSWTWRLESPSDFSVKSARNYIDDSFLPSLKLSLDGLVLFLLKLTFLLGKSVWISYPRD
nr:hypothetical protein [Tanacetum cinerariifolium]